MLWRWRDSRNSQRGPCASDTNTRLTKQNFKPLKEVSEHNLRPSKSSAHTRNSLVRKSHLDKNRPHVQKAIASLETAIGNSKGYIRYAFIFLLWGDFLFYFYCHLAHTLVQFSQETYLYLVLQVYRHTWLQACWTVQVAYWWRTMQLDNVQPQSSLPGPERFTVQWHLFRGWLVHSKYVFVISNHGVGR